MEKDEILANLYALRAGLSVVAVNGDKIDKKLKKAKADAEKDVAAARERKQETKDAIYRENRNISEMENALDARSDSKTRKRKHAAKSAGFSVVNSLIGILIIAVSVAMILCFVYSVTFWLMVFGVFGDPPTSEFILRLYGYLLPYIANRVPETWLMLTLIGATVLSLVIAIGGIILFVGRHRFRFEVGKLEDGVDDGLPKTKRVKKDIEAGYRYVAILENELPRRDDDIEKAIENGNAAIAQTCSALEPICSATNALYEALRQVFSPVIDERDWENLDLLTYYIETGRADSLKEGLQLLDRQKQTDQIVAAVGDAAKAIGRAVKEGLGALQNDMRRCFNILSNQITTVGRMVDVVAGGIDAMGSRISSVENAVASQNAQLAEIASVASMNNALAARANDNSAKLLSCARTCAENSDYVSSQLRQAQISGRL